MSSGIVTFAEVCQAMSATGVPFAAFSFDGDPTEHGYQAYGVVSLTGGIQLCGDDSVAEQGMRGTVDLYTTHLDASEYKSVSDALDGLEIPYYLNSVSFNQSRRLLHYEWVWSTPGPLETTE